MKLRSRRRVVLPGESREEFQQLCDDLEVEWHPKTRTEEFSLEQMAVSQRKLRRTEVAGTAARAATGCGSGFNQHPKSNIQHPFATGKRYLTPAPLVR